MDKVTFYLPFHKKDSDKKIVEGYASTEAVDSQGEVVKSGALKKALPDYMKYGNIREMHQWSAVGKTIAAKMDGKKKGLWIRGKIIDKDAWEKVKEEVYNGFSIGGKIIKKVGKVIEAVKLNEISLVDRPANPEAVFSLVKFDKEGKVIEKQLPIPPVGIDGIEENPFADEFAGIKIADRLIAMTGPLVSMIKACSEVERPTKHMERVLKALKTAAMWELQQEKAVAAKKIEEMKRNNLKKVDALEKEVKARTNVIEDPAWIEGYFKELTKAL